MYSPVALPSMNDLVVGILLGCSKVELEVVASSGAHVGVGNGARGSAGVAGGACGRGILDDGWVGEGALEVEEHAGAR